MKLFQHLFLIVFNGAFQADFKKIKINKHSLKFKLQTSLAKFEGSRFILEGCL